MRLKNQVSASWLSLWLVGMGAVAACQRSPSPEPVVEQANPTPTPPAEATGQSPTPTPSAAAARNPHAGAAELGVTWSDPEGWERVTTKSPMRAAEYKVPPAAGDTEAAEVTVFYFGADMGGGVDENLNRWAKQFTGVNEADVKRTSRDSNGLTHHLIHVPKGEYAGMAMMGGSAPAKRNYGMLGAVTVAPSGKYFFKMTGPSNTVAANQASFEKLIESVKSK